MSKRIAIELTRVELELLIYGLHAGLIDDSIENIGLTKREQAILRRLQGRLRGLITRKS